jgi:hypothetical protein
MSCGVNRMWSMRWPSAHVRAVFVCWQVGRVDVGRRSVDQDAPAGLGVLVELVDLKGRGPGAQATCERGVRGVWIKMVPWSTA